MKNKGLILILAGIFVILAGIAIYGYVGAREAFPTAAEFDAMYDNLAKAGQTGMMASKSVLFNFFIRYRVVFAIAAAVSFAGGAAVLILKDKKQKNA